MKLEKEPKMFAVGQGAEKKLMSWVSKRVPKQFITEDFPTCFKDGILLCVLAEKVAPGACPRFDLLDPDQPLRNLKLALHLVEKHIQIKPTITSDEILQGGVFAEKRLLLLIAQMKMASEEFALPAPSPEHSDDVMSQKNTSVSNRCLARGMGLLVAVRSRRACFSVVVESIENLDMIIEVRGPNNTACSKRITSAMSLSRKHFADVKNVQDALIEEEILKKKIPLEYTILGQKISVSYTPLETGKHTISIICQGQHIAGSPYTICVDESSEFPDMWDKPASSPIQIHNHSKNQIKQCFDSTSEKNGAVASSITPGKIIKKRVLRYIVKVEGNDVVIDGKEDLCNAINRVKKQLRKVSKEEKNDTIGNDSKCALENNFLVSDGRNKTDILSNSDLNVLSYATSDSVVSENTGKESSVLDKENNSLNHAFLAKNNDVNYLSNDLLSKKVNKCIIPDNENTNSKSDGDIDDKADDNCSQTEDKLKAIRTTSDIEDITNENETSSDKTKKKDVNELNNNLSDERDVKLHLYQRHNDFSDSDINSNNGTEVRRNSATDDVSFYPVHKVEYELLQDDDEEPEELCDYNPKRRISYTELFESNYLDGDIEMVDVIKVSEIESFCPGVENDKAVEKSPRPSENHQNDLKKHGPGDIRNCLRANHDLFLCDHNLSFWSETVTETPPEFVPCEGNTVDIDSESHVDSPSENSRFENPDHQEVTLELDKSATLEKVNLENKDAIHIVKSTTGDEEYVPYDPISFSFKNTDLNKLEDNDLELIRNSLLKELPDNKKRSSWPDRDLLPAIRESSIEDFIDLEACENELRNEESKDSNAPLTASESVNKLSDNECVFPSSSSITPVTENEEESSQMVSQTNVSPSSANKHCSVLNLAKEYESRNMISRQSFNDTSQRTKDTNRYAFSSMNILSASPYKCRNKHSDIKFTCVAYTERPRSQSVGELNVSTPINSSNRAVSSSQPLSNGFILTHAVPAVVKEHQNITPEDKSCSEVISDTMQLNTNLDPNAYDLKSSKPPSVKNVIEIFQREKEEPLDTWPTESRAFKSSHQKLDADMFMRKSPERSESPDQKNCLLSCMEASRSTIKDRVKAFESDEKKDSAVASKKNNVQKCAISTISDKKKYWENFMS